MSVSWPNRDPLGEDGGFNLYAAMQNNMIIYLDYLGLEIVIGPIIGDFDLVIGLPRPPTDYDWPPLPPRPPQNRSCPTPDSSYSRCSPCNAGDTRGRRQRQRRSIANGCGSQTGLAGLIPIPNNPPFMRRCDFTPACDGHDCCWGTCNASRVACDEKFLRDVLAICRSCTRAGTRQRRRCDRWAQRFAGVVSSILGTGSYGNAQREACEECCCP